MIILHDLDGDEMFIDEKLISFYQRRDGSELTKGIDNTYIELNDTRKSYIRVLETPNEISALLSSNSGKSKSTKALQLIINLIDNTDIDEISDNDDFIKGYELAIKRAIDIIRQFKDY